MRSKSRYSTAASLLLLLAFSPFASAASVFQPPGSNLVLGDVTHGMRVQSASSNPAAAAADFARRGEGKIGGTVLSGSAGIEYGNVQDIFDFIDDVSQGFAPSPPGDIGDLPGQNPDDKPDSGLDLDHIWDSLDPDTQAAIEAVANEIVTQSALLALIANEGYGKAWLAADAPFVLSNEHWGGSWTFGVNWFGTSKAFGITEPIDFDADVALANLEEALSGPAQLPTINLVRLSESIELVVDGVSGTVGLLLLNDSSLVTKASQLTELNLGYSRPAWSGDSGTLFFGAEAKLYFMQLSRLSVRFGDITDSQELFDAILNSDFRDDTEIGLDLGVLWVGRNYQLGAQITNVNSPEFEFPEVNLEPYSSEDIKQFLTDDQFYTMDSQVKLEGSIMSENRKWSVHAGIDVDPATDPLGDQYQWATVSAGYNTDSWWIPGVRLGYRKNMTGTGMTYLGLGATLFKHVNFDISSALDTVSIDGTELPQGLMVSLGFQINW